MHIVQRAALAAILFAALLVSPSAAQVAPATVEQKVVFTVDGVNILGTIVGPANVLAPGAGVAAATLYLHGFGHGKYIWSFNDVPGYNFAAEMAKLGHVSVAIDRLNYDQSSHLVGLQSSMQRQVETAAAVVTQLKAGTYKMPAGPAAWRFGRVAIAGLSAGGGIAESIAWQSRNVDALVSSGWNDDLFGRGTPLTVGAFMQLVPLCNDPTRAGYEYFGQTLSDFVAINFANAERSVTAAALKYRNPEACGDALTVPDMAYANLARASTIQIPTLLLWGGSDATFDQAAPADARAHFTGADVTLTIIPNTGHLWPLEKTAPQGRAALSQWLRQRGF